MATLDLRRFLRRGALITLVGFLLMFAIRLGYGYIAYPPGSVIEELPQTSQNQIRYESRNFATKKLKSSSLQQKYEKIAEMNAQTGAFDKDEKQLRNLIKDYDTLIQFEKREGVNKKRRLFLAIGVHPQKFDSFIEELRKIGRVTNLTISKTDKTNEYTQLNAHREALSNQRRALRRLKGRGPVKDQIELENQILQTEREIQKLRVSLGDFDKENEFCTVKYNLQESNMIARSLTFLYRAKVAFQWSVKYYAIILTMFFFGSIGLFATGLALEKLKWVPRFVQIVYASIKGFFASKLNPPPEGKTENSTEKADSERKWVRLDD